MKKQSRRSGQLKAAGACLGVVMGGATLLHAQDAATDKITQLQKDNQALQGRLDVLEALAKKEGLLPSGATPPKFLGAMSDSTLSGFVTTSFFHDTSNPPGGFSPGYLWSRRNNSFELNKVKLTLASAPAERSGDKFSAGYRVSFIAGQDAPVVNSGTAGIGLGIREAFIDMNLPIGTGLNFKMGELISLLNYESGDGGAANNNFSQGYQWFYTGNGPAAGIQLGYTLTDWLDVKFRLQNGLYAGPLDNNSSKTMIGAIDIKPSKTSWVNLLGFGGREDAGFAQQVVGGSLLGGWQVTDQFGLGTELDLFTFGNPPVPPAGVPKGNSTVWSTGLWADYAFTKQVDAALRAEFLSDHRGVDASGDPLGFALNTGQDISSVAFTLNYKPFPNLKFQPEIRYDHTSLPNGFGSKKNRVDLGVGVIYYF